MPIPRWPRLRPDHATPQFVNRLAQRAFAGETIVLALDDARMRTVLERVPDSGLPLRRIAPTH